MIDGWCDSDVECGVYWLEGICSVCDYGLLWVFNSSNIVKEGNSKYSIVFSIVEGYGNKWDLRWCVLV